MTLRTAALAIVSLTFTLPAASQPKPAAGCGRLFTARVFDKDSAKGGSEVACQGPLLRIALPELQGRLFIDSRVGGRNVWVFDSTREYYDHVNEEGDTSTRSSTCR